MNKNKYIFLVLFILLVLETACGKASTNNTSKTPATLPTPESGEAVVTGKVFSTTTNQPLKTQVWLAEVHRQGDQAVYVLNAVSSPGIYSDETGVFVLENITPQEYVIVVGNPEGQNEVINDDAGKPKVWNVPAGQIYDVGELKVTLRK
jgi:hypothetical protein